jgi:hypothetical protein
MSEDYRSMWVDLGLDLDAHDALLGILGQGYRDIFLAQKNRPETMGYFDFVMSEVHGLRIKELLDEKAAGRKIIGSYCVFVPEEIVLAANATLVGLCSGADFATQDVERLLPRNTCALIKSAFGFRAAGMINRVSFKGDIVFTGGVAKNPCMCLLLEQTLSQNVLSPKDPQRLAL